jgi:hypothetical protein
MRCDFPRLTAVALSIVAILTQSCATSQRLTAAATTQGKAQAGVVLPDWPDDCRKTEAHASVTEGAEVRSILIRERAQLDKQNARTGRCSSFYDTLKTNFAGRK